MDGAWRGLTGPGGAEGGGAGSSNGDNDGQGPSRGGGAPSRRLPSCEENDRVSETGGPSGRRRTRRTGGRAKRAHSPEGDGGGSSSDTGNDDYSVGSDECCIYTYRGGEHLADLHSSFFSLDVGPAAEPHLPAPPLFGPRQEPRPEPRHEPQHEERAPSSPDMDYLEMDFDPGPYCEVDSDEESSSDAELDVASNSKENGVNRSPVFDEPVKKESNLDIKADPSPSKLSNSDAPALNSFSNETQDNSPSVKLCNGRGPYDLDICNQPSTSKMNLPSTSKADQCEPAPFTDVNETNLSTNACVKKVIKRDLPNSQPYGALIPHVTVFGDVIYVRRTSLSWPTREIQGHHNSSGDLISPGEACEGDSTDTFSGANIGLMSPEQACLLEASRVNHSSALFHCTMAKKLVIEKQAVKFLQEHDTSNIDGAGSDGAAELPIVSKCMVWSEQEACSRQITQIGTSACGATAVINVLLALKQFVDLERITSAVGTRLRANNAPLSRYLISRAIAGSSVEPLAAGLHTGSGGAVSSRHFSTWPERAVSLSHWLAYWIELGGVPIATLNLQADVVDLARIPDSWHHQMIFGVGPRGIYMTNPVECIEEGALWHQLCSDSVLLIKRKDILSRWNRDTDLTPLMNVPGDDRWKTMNVLGQVVNMIRESQNTNGTICTTHIRIPACYSAGITIAVLTGTEAHKRLVQAPELPLLIPEDE
ncbi:uncharacterized protein LOC143916775 [Arctopsyche grandis]|uniref:uncharacterized protein LOC143916775 n=1 Tax=Arctopsyche grandis TaxID=121162 RepID=UPI00406D637B